MVRIVLFLFSIFSLQTPDINKPVFTIRGYAQGTSYTITYIKNNEAVTKNQVDSILDKIDSSLSLYKSYSIINRFNNSSSGCRADDHFIQVVNKSLETYNETGGAFDITIKPLVQAWGFGVKAVDSLPGSTVIAAIKQCIGSRFLQVEKDSVRKDKPCIQIDCNGITQGYSVDVVADFLERNDIENYLVELGGEIRVKGKNQSDKTWTIGLEAPVANAYFLPVQRTIRMDAGAITTSGNYRNYFSQNGKKYSHIINPLTGYPSDNGLVSVTVIAKDAITADAFDNAFMVMGLERSMEFLAGKKDVEAFFIYQERNGNQPGGQRIKDTATKGFSKYLTK